MWERNLLSKRIVEAVNRMPAQVRRVFILSHYRGFSRKEIAGCLGIMESDVQSLLRSGNTLLYQALPVL